MLPSVDYPTVAGSGVTEDQLQGLGLDMADMDAETLALIKEIQRAEHEEENMRDTQRRRQLEADEELARKEQQSERDVWQSLQDSQLANRQRAQEQIDADEQEAVSSPHPMWRYADQCSVESRPMNDAWRANVSLKKLAGHGCSTKENWSWTASGAGNLLRIEDNERSIGSLRRSRINKVLLPMAAIPQIQGRCVQCQRRTTGGHLVRLSSITRG